MCKPDIPEPPPPPPKPVDFTDEYVRQAADVEEDRRNNRLTGLASTISNAATGVLTPTRTARPSRGK